MGQRAIARGRFLLVAVVAAVLAPAVGALAHSGVESYVYLELFDDTIEGQVHYPIPDLNEVLDLSLDPDSGGLEDDVQASAPAITGYTAENLDFFGDDGVWPVTFEGLSLLGDEADYVIVDFRVDRTFDAVPRVFDVEYSGIVAEKPERSALLLIATDFGSGTFNNDAEHLLVFSDDATRQTVDLGERSLLKGVTATIALGAEHIQIGFDHILFIIALVLPSVLVFRRRRPGTDAGEAGWVPTPTFGSGLWRVVKIATSFTVAHTVTLTLGGLGLVELSPDLVEPIIALSIALAAAHNIRPVFFNREWALAFAFGLFHGFGFAGLLANLGLDRSNRIVSLLGFNVGIELGQIVIILLVFPSLFLLRRTRTYERQMAIGSAGLVVVSLVWFVERVFGLDLRITEAVEWLLDWPRALLVAAGLAVYAVSYWWWERGRGRLIAIEWSDRDRDDDLDDDVEPVPTGRR